MRADTIWRTWGWPLVAALVIAAAAWFITLPGFALSQDQLVPPRMPQTRAVVDKARAAFDQAETAYKSYVQTHDMGALLTSIRGAISVARQPDRSRSAYISLADIARQAVDYLAQLHDYAQAGDAYLASLRAYDDDLMAWTRSLGPRSEQLRTATYPVVEYLKQYPEPVGQVNDPPQISAAQVLTTTNALRRDLEPLALGGSDNPNTRSEQISALERDVNDTWAEGRSVEYMNGLHRQYEADLREYDRQVQVVAAETDRPSGGSALSIAANLAVGVVLVAGLVFLLSRRARPAEGKAAG